MVFCTSLASRGSETMGPTVGPPNNPLGLTLALSGPSDLLTCTLLAFRPRNARHFHRGDWSQQTRSSSSSCDDKFCKNDHALYRSKINEIITVFKMLIMLVYLVPNCFGVYVIVKSKILIK